MVDLKKRALKSETLKKIYSKATNEKNKTKSLIQECLELAYPTNPSLDLSYGEQGSINDKTITQYDDTLKIATTQMVNYISDTITPAGQVWANFILGEKNKKQNEEDRETYDIDDKPVLTVGDKITQAVFKEINETNAINPLYQSYENLVGGGNGSVKIVEMPLFAKQVTQTRNVPLDNLFFFEDAYEKIEFVMYLHNAQNIRWLYDNFGKENITLPPEHETLDPMDIEFKEFNFLEGAVLVDRDGAVNKYIHFVTTENCEHFYYCEEITYQPFVVFRWAKPNNNFQWGLPIATKIIANLRTLNESVELEMKKARLMLAPPLLGIVDPSFMPYMDTETLISQAAYKPGTVTYINGVIGYQPVITTYDMQMSVINSDNIRQTIYALYNVNPLGNVENTRYRTAEEMALRHQQFSKQFAPTYGRLMKELLEPYLKTLMHILIKRGVIDLTEDEKGMLKDLKIEFINPITKLAAQEKVQAAINFKMMMSQVINPDVFKYLFDDINFPYVMAKELNITPSILNNKADVKKGLDQEQKQKEAMMLAMQQNGMMGGGVPNGGQQAAPAAG